MGKTKKKKDVGIDGKDSVIQADDSNTILSSKENGLEKLFDYFIKETSGNPIPFGKWEKVSLFLELLGGTGGIYSWPPAKQYGEDKPAWISYSLQVSNPLSNVLFLINATDNLFDAVTLEFRTPQQLSNIIKLPTKKQLASKYIKMLLGSVVCAVPFAIVTYLFPLPFCTKTYCLGITVTHSEIANTILHVVSWNLILSDQYWFYRLPILPFEKGYQFLRNACLTQAERQLLVIKKNKADIYQKYKNHIGQFFISNTEKIAKGYIKIPIEDEESVFKLISHQNSSFAKFAELVAADKNISPQPESSSGIGAICSKAHRFLKNGGMGFLGASFMVVGCIGLIVNPIYVGLLENLGLPASIAIGALPAYSTAVLCAFYGAATFNEIYDYLTSWSHGCTGKFSFEVKLYPKTFALYLLLNLYISAFAFGTALQLISTVFGDEMWDEYRPYLEGISIPAFQILSFVPLLDLFNTFVRKSVAKFGAENDETLAARLLVKSAVMNQRLKQIRGKVLMESINQFSQEQRNAFGIDPNEYQTDMKTLSDLEGQKDEIYDEVISSARKKDSSCCKKFSPFWNKEKDEAKALLGDALKKESYDAVNDSAISERKILSHGKNL